jgi:hypothetical protein
LKLPPAGVDCADVQPAHNAASQRMEVWRKLKRYGTLQLESGGYLLPNNPQTLEHFEWLAEA